MLARRPRLRKKPMAKRVQKAAPPQTPATPTNAPIYAELGATGLQRYNGLIGEEWLHQLKGKNALKVYREMSENDAIVAAILYAIEMLLRPVTWSVERGGETPADEEAAEFLESVVEDMSHGTADFISEWMATPVYGWSLFEVVLKQRNGDNVEPGLASKFTDGRIGVRKLAIRHPDTLDRWIFDDAGGLKGMVQRTAPKWVSTEIPIERALLFRTQMRKGNPEGRSLLRAAYIAWFYRKKLEKIEAIGIERNMAGFPLIYHPAEWAIDGSPYSQMLADIKKIAQRIKVDEQAGVALPAIFDENGNRLLELTLVNTGGRISGDISPVIERWARYMAMSVLADVIFLGHEKVGSFALASSKTDLFAAGLGALKDDIEAVWNRHLVPRLMRLNGFKLEKYPQYRLSDLESVDLTEVADYIQKLSAAGFPLFPSENNELEKELMRFANLPVPENFPERPEPVDPFADPDANPEKDDDEDEDA